MFDTSKSQDDEKDVEKRTSQRSSGSRKILRFDTEETSDYITKIRSLIFWVKNYTRETTVGHTSGVTEEKRENRREDLQDGRRNLQKGVLLERNQEETRDK